MSTPVTTDDVVQGCVKWLEAFEDVTDALGSYPGGVPYLFQHTLWIAMEGSGTTAAVIARAGGWSGPNEYNTARFPRLSLEIWADPQRVAGNVVDPGETWRRIEASYQALDKRLHRPNPATIYWGTVRTFGCHRLTEPIVYAVPDGDGLLRLQTFYGVSTG